MPDRTWKTRKGRAMFLSWCSPASSKAICELAVDLPMSVVREADPSWLRHSLKPCRDVDTVAVKVASFYDYIAKIDPDTQYDPPVFSNAAAGDSHGLLQLDGTVDGVYRAGELYQHPVAHKLDDATTMLRHQRLDDIFVPGLKRGQGADLIGSHHAAVANYISGQNRGKAALGAFFDHIETWLPQSAAQ